MAATQASAHSPSSPFSSAAESCPVPRGTLRGPGYVPLLRGAHQPADIPLTHGRRIEGFRAVDGPDHVLLGHSAAWALGARFAGPSEPVAAGISSHHRLRRRREVLPHLARLAPEEVLRTDLGVATTPARTAIDIARGIGCRGLAGDLRVARVDAVLRATGTPSAEVRRLAVALRRLHGLPYARVLLSSCADGVDSPRETLLRLLVVRAGFPPPRTQCPVFLDGRQVAALDLGWEEHRVGLEYDGKVHDDPDQLALDRVRHNLIRLAGWRVLQVDRRLYARRGELIRQLHTLFATV
jgi:hypothetical protein